jgi:EAL domain-containing protein (putative c-di-GMP-specific phosphodiesterase class I)
VVVADPRRALIIDDDPAIAELVANAARSSGFEAIATTDPAEFKTLMEEDPAGLVVLDLQMPDVDGIELLRHLAESDASPGVILMSGAEGRIVAAAERLARQYDLNVRAVMRKPFRLAELRNVLGPLAPLSSVLSEEELRRALSAREFYVEYQPILPLGQSGRRMQVQSVEALARWRHPQHGLVSPADFIPRIEQYDLATLLTDQIVSQVLDQLQAWDRQGRCISANVNLAGSSLKDAALPDRLWKLVADAGIPPARINFEVTETTAMEDPTLSLEVLGRIRLKGFGLFIDDFGTGYSSLIVLHRMPFNGVKIDKSFVLESDTSDEARVIVRAIADLAHNLGLTVCAEGVERVAHLATVKQVGCDLVQGFLFSKPVPPKILPLELLVPAEDGPASGPPRPGYGDAIGGRRV